MRRAVWIVATVLTACGIETTKPLVVVIRHASCNSTYRLRYWNHTLVIMTSLALRHSCNSTYRLRYWNSLIVPYLRITYSQLQQYLPLAVLKRIHRGQIWPRRQLVATVLTACGIETQENSLGDWVWSPRVATVLTACGIETKQNNVPYGVVYTLQQYLPLAVLKRICIKRILKFQPSGSCNSTYRLRYWNIVLSTL